MSGIATWFGIALVEHPTPWGSAPAWVLSKEGRGSGWKGYSFKPGSV